MRIADFGKTDIVHCASRKLATVRVAIKQRSIKMKSVLISIQPKWVEKIANGEKTIEVRKSAPKEVPFKAYIYETQGRTETPWVDEDGHFIYKGRGQVIGEFICNNASELDYVYYWNNGYEFATCLTYRQVADYGKGKTLYGWHISDLKIYDKPKELSEFSRPCSYSGLCFSCKRTSFKKDGNLLCNTKITRPPQSWMYVEELQEKEK